MAKSPSLLTLCIGALRDYFLYGVGDDDEDGNLKGIYELPTELFDCLLKQLPALALHRLQLQMPTETVADFDVEYDYCEIGRKRVRCDKFDMAWKVLYHLRWPERIENTPGDPLVRDGVQKCETLCDWRQNYWETHLQNCFDVAAERAMLPSFNGCIAEIEIPGAMINTIGYQPKYSMHSYSLLCSHCQEFGSYVRFLRLQNVFCCEETSHLLTSCKLQGLVLRRICSKMHVDGLCRILNQNGETLTSLELINCKLSSDVVEAICNSLNMEGKRMHGVKHFAVRASKLLEENTALLPPKLISFLSSRSLESLSFCDDHIGRSHAKLTLMTLLDASSPLSTLDLSDNNISGWLSEFHVKSAGHSLLSGESKSLQALRVLNLKGNNLRKNDVEDLRAALVYLPILERLDLADNPIEDVGVKSLISFFVKTAGHTSLADLNLRNCKISCGGATELLEVLLALKYPLSCLSLADNDLGSEIAPALGDFLRTSIRSLDIRDIGLGSSGFVEFRISMPDTVNLISIDISENRGGIQAAEFLEELISKAPELLVVRVGYNLMPSDSLKIICSALKIAKGKLQLIVLMGNHKLDLAENATLVTEFQSHGRPTVLIPTLASQSVPYDDDP